MKWRGCIQNYESIKKALHIWIKLYSSSKKHRLSSVMPKLIVNFEKRVMKNKASR